MDQIIQKKEITQQEAHDWIKSRWNTLTKDQLTEALTKYWKKYGQKSIVDEAKMIFAEN